MCFKLTHSLSTFLFIGSIKITMFLFKCEMSSFNKRKKTSKFIIRIMRVEIFRDRNISRSFACRSGLKGKFIYKMFVYKMSVENIWNMWCWNRIYWIVSYSKHGKAMWPINRKVDFVHGKHLVWELELILENR